MPIQALVVDTDLTIDGEPYRIKIVSKDGTLHMVSRKSSGKTLLMSYEDLLAAILKGNAKVKPPAQKKLDSVNLAEVNAKLKRDIESLTPNGRIEFERRWNYIRPINAARLRRLQKKVIVPVIADVAMQIRDPAPPSFDTVRRWYREFLAGHRDIRALFPNTALRGWRTRRNPVEVSTIARQAISEVYMSREQNTVQATYEYFEGLIAAANEEEDRKLPLVCPSLRWFYREIHKQFDGYDLDLARKGKIVAELNYRPWGMGARPTRPLERVEIDHTTLDVMVVDDDTREKIGRPYLTVAIDVATRMIVGFYVSFKAPSVHSVVKCLRHTITPKKDALSRYPDVKNSWDACGIPETIVIDNGREFHSKDVEEACRHLNINVHHTPRREPWQKPKVERFFGTLNTKVLAGLPGKTFSNIIRKGDYKPEKEATVGFAALIEMLYVWFVDGYNQIPHPATLMAPAHAWAQSAAAFPPVPVSAEDLNFALTHVKQRRVQPIGIQLAGLKYQSEDLAEMRKRHLGHLEVTIRYDIDDLGSIIVVDPDTGGQVRVPCVDQEYAVGLSVAQHLVIRTFLRNTTNKKILRLTLREVRRLIQLIIMRERQKKKGWTKKSAIFGGVDSDVPAGRLSEDDERLLKLVEMAASKLEDAVPDEDPDGDANSDIIETIDEEEGDA